MNTIGFVLLSLMCCIRHSYGIPTIALNLQFGNCRSSSDCGSGSCCVVGMMRYSVPMCMPVLQLGDNCRPASNNPTNLTLWYPNETQINLYDVYQILCPCDPEQGLVCHPTNGICTSNMDLSVSNDV